MIYLIVGEFVILFILILALNSKQNIKLMNLEGIPISLPFPDNSINVIEQKNYVICLSVSCPHCRKIIEDLQKLPFNTNNVFVVFAEEETAVNNYLKQYESLNFEYLSDITTKDLYTLNTPFTYVLNENKIIVDKKIIKNISSLDIS
ncbi:hypothetical protein ISO30_12395 [Staphylococcus saprophyticus]|uniref:hypothetical protein n=1 Tax=Staphylococcus saprophyticus TaxID=29385 RepID=UPI001887A5AF|nr:hypothetical protein [Staphylococcus saprophyticus]MBF2782498.1 hypothetical protein [Staphylococcus saprophyticus]